MDDLVMTNVSQDGAVSTDLGTGNDTVVVSADQPTEVRLTFTSSEVGNGTPNDANTMANQDGGLAVRLQAENALDGLVGPVSRYDDEGISFVGDAGVRFDVRDLVSGVQRGNMFDVVRLGTLGNDIFNEGTSTRAYYINAGMGADRITGGRANDFLVGGAGDDVLNGGLGNDSLLGGGGNDTILGGNGNDTALFNVTTDGADQVDLGSGNDVVLVSAAAPTQVRLTFTSSEVGNNNQNDSNTLANQDGGLALRLQAEDGSDGLTGALSRFDDGNTFVASSPGVTFDVRDLVSGVQRGNQFEVVVLGSSGADNLTAVQPGRPYYFNAGMGNDTITGGTANDFLVGGAANDSLTGGLGNDTLLGGAGNDVVLGGNGNDTALFNVTTDGVDQVDLGSGSDVVLVSATAPTQVRLTFTSSEVGNNNSNDSNTMVNQDGGLAVRLQAEDGADALVGPVSRLDDGNTFVASSPGVTFDVRDLVSGVQRGDLFEVVVLGSSVGDNLFALQPDRPYYFNAGRGNDTITGGTANDFLVGGAADDSLNGGLGIDTHIGGVGADVFVFATTLGASNVDRINDFDIMNDLIQLDDAIFTGLAGGALGAGAFALATAAGQADDRIVYDRTTGDLFFDEDGGSRDDLTQFANLFNKPANLSADDFFVV